MDAVAERPPIVYVTPAPRVEEPRALEVGAGAFLMQGGALGGYAGATAFLIAEISDNVALRPSVAFGEVTSTRLRSTLTVGRLDTCARVPGHYRTGNGIQLDVCGGIGAGFSYVAATTDAGGPPASVTLPHIDVGPSVGLRGEIGRIAVFTRFVGGVEIARDGFADVTGTRIVPPLWMARYELVFSWDVRGAPEGT